MCVKRKFVKCLTLLIVLLADLGLPCWANTPQEVLKVSRQCATPGLVALTFDDGPSPNGQTQKVLEVLREKGVKATFFVTGQGFDTTYLSSDERKKKLLKQIFEEGHQIGSHTWTHPNLAIMSKARIQRNIARLANVAGELLDVNMTIFRPPYGFINCRVGNLIEQQFGYRIVKWNLDTKDWVHRENVEQSLAAYKDEMKEAEAANTSSSSSFITLQHDPAPRSDQLARLAIDFVRSKGFKLVTVGECIGVPNFRPRK